MTITIDHSGLDQLANDLAASGSGIAAEMEPVVRSQGRELRDKARENARRTAGAHGRWYPRSITDTVQMQSGAIFAEVGPDPNKAQGGMSFEFGSAHQPPHNDLGDALAVQGPLFQKEVKAAVEKLLRAHGL